jgi:hypothetical protein
LRPGDRERGQLLACQAALIRIQRGLEMYAREHDKQFPPDWTALEPYLQALDPEHPRQLCPVARQETYKAGYQVSADFKSCTVVCQGQNHPGVPSDHPRWSSQQGLQERYDRVKGTDDDKCGIPETFEGAALIYRYKLVFDETTELTSIAVTGAAFNGGALRVLDESMNVLGTAYNFGGNTFQPFFEVMMQSPLIIIDKNTCCNMHCIT